VVVVEWRTTLLEQGVKVVLVAVEVGQVIVKKLLPAQLIQVVAVVVLKQHPEHTTLAQADQA
jgi:hypothetical protein